MTTNTEHCPSSTPVGYRSNGLIRRDVLATIAAAVATTVTAAIARAADVPLEVDGEPIPLSGFAFLTVIWSVVGIVLAAGLARWAPAPRSTFLTVTIALTVVSCIPSFAVDADTATSVVLAATHLVAAAIVIPSIAHRLDRRTSRAR